MALVTTDNANYAAIAEAIRARTGGSGKLTPAQMPAAIAGITGLENAIAGYSQMNAQADAYLTAADAAYTDENSASVTVMPSYADAAAKWDGCAGYALTLPAAGVLHLMDESEPGRSWSMPVSAGSGGLYNLIPGHVYRYFLLDSSGAARLNGRVRPTGPLRMIRMSYMHNVRDMGGWRCAAGTVNYGLLYRGQAISGDPADHRILLEQLRIGADIDLREDEEASYIIASRLGGRVMYHRYPLETGYKSLVELSGSYWKLTKAALEKVMEYASLGIPTYFHCSIGCDRTGLLGYLIGALLGMSRADLDKNYELSSLTGTVDTANVTGRLRTRSDWNAMAAYLAGLGGGTPQEQVLSWCGRVGISARLVNRFRAAMCSGTPAAVTITNRITNALTNMANTNSATTVANGASYMAAIKPNTGAAVESVKITMAGEDITGCYDPDTGNISIPEVLGDIVITAAASYQTTTVTLNLTDVAAANTDSFVVVGLDYSNTLSVTPDKRFQSVTVMMDGTDITATAYNANTGMIRIEAVTGPVVITAVAEQIPVNYVNQIPISQSATGTDVFNGVGYMDGKYLSSGGNGEGTDAGFFATGFIPWFDSEGPGKMTIYVKGADWTNVSHCRLNVYNADKELKLSTQGSYADVAESGKYFNLTVLDPVKKYWKLETVIMDDGTPFIRYNFGWIKYFRLSLAGSGAGVIVTRNEPVE